MTLGRRKRVTKDVLVTMTNLTVAQKEAEECLARGDLAGLIENLNAVVRISTSLKDQVEAIQKTEAR